MLKIIGISTLMLLVLSSIYADNTKEKYIEIDYANSPDKFFINSENSIALFDLKEQKDVFIPRYVSHEELDLLFHSQCTVSSFGNGRTNEKAYGWWYKDLCITIALRDNSKLLMVCVRNSNNRITIKGFNTMPWTYKYVTDKFGEPTIKNFQYNGFGYTNNKYKEMAFDYYPEKDLIDGFYLYGIDFK